MYLVGTEVTFDTGKNNCTVIHSYTGAADADTMASYTEEIRMDTTAITKEGEAYVPIRYLAEVFGYTVNWDGAAQTVSVIETTPAPIPLTYTNDELGFSMQLPALLEGHMRVEESERMAYDETVKSVNFYYVGEKTDAHVISLEEMSTAVWEQMQAEGGDRWELCLVHPIPIGLW